QCAGLGPHLSFERRVFEAAFEGTINTGNGQRIAPPLAPRLPGGVGQQAREGPRSDAIVRAHARAVIEEKVPVVDARVCHELAHYARALFEAAIRTLDF